MVSRLQNSFGQKHRCTFTANTTVLFTLWFVLKWRISQTFFYFYFLSLWNDCLIFRFVIWPTRGRKVRGSGPPDVQRDDFVYGKWSLECLWVLFMFYSLRNDTDAPKMSGGSGGQGGGVSVHCGGGGLRYLCFGFVAVSIADGFTRVAATVVTAFILLLCGRCVGLHAVVSSTFFKIKAYWRKAKSLSILLPLKPPMLWVWQLLRIDFHCIEVFTQVITSMSDEMRSCLPSDPPGCQHIRRK